MTIMIPRGGKNEDGVVSVVVDGRKDTIPRGVEVEWPTKPMTNADRFRKMSDEEQQRCVRGFWEIEDFADWLKQPAEEETT